MSFGTGLTFLPGLPYSAPVGDEKKDMPRWIMASCRVFFDQRRGRWPMFFMHTAQKDLKKDSGQAITSYFEFRLDGPYIQQLTANETRYTIEINILCIANVDPKFSDQMEMMLGQMAAAFAPVIPFFRFGDQPQDTRTQIGCLVLLQEKNDSVIISRFNQANPATEIIQASVEGHYEFRLCKI